MRVISQNGDIDVPYELVAVHRSELCILMNMAGDTGKGSVLATYSTKAKVIKVMKMLREAYTGKLICQNVDLSDDKVAELLKNWYMQAITVANSDTTRVDYINNCVFQFPKDEDVEVEDEN